MHEKDTKFTDEYWMLKAQEMAKKAFDKQEVPVGAVLVKNNDLLASSYNQVESCQDASCHAELQVLKEGAKRLGGWRLHGCTLYCTLEPCIMCYGAMIHFRLDRLVWAAPDIRHGALGSLYDLSFREHPIHKIKITPHFMAEYSAELMRSFFQQRRKQS